MRWSMPAAYSATTSLASVKVTVMSTISNMSGSSTFSTLDSGHKNSVAADATTTAAKYIQLQPVQSSIPAVVNTNQVSASGAAQRISNSVQVVTAPRIQTTTSGINIPPGMVLATNPIGQIVLVNGSQATSTAPQQMVTNQPVATPITKIITTVTATTASAMTTIGKPVSVSSPASTVVSKTPDVKPLTVTPQISLSEEDQVNVGKCRSFLTTLIKLASTGGQLQTTVRTVKALVQNLIDDKISAEEFTKRLQIELKSSPQPYLVPFLKKSLPLLRLTMMQQNQGGPVPANVAAAAIRVSSLASDSTKSPSSPKSKPVPAKITKSGMKYLQSNIPDIRLPRVTSSDPPLKHPSLQTPSPHMSLQQPPHPSAVAGAQPSTLTTMRSASTSLNRANQRWTTVGASASGGGYKEDDDINDVTSMAGVNLSEESARISATNSELVGTQTRSCHDETVVNAALLQKRMSQIASKTPNIQRIHSDAVKLLACAAETRLKDFLEKLSTVVCHRMNNYREEEHYKACSDVKTQLKFLQELDHIEKKKHDEAERDILMRAMKSRSKNDNPEQLRLKERAKEMQQQELEKLQIRNADETARNAIGPRKKKAKLENARSSSLFENHSGASAIRSTARSRTKRVNLRDLMFVMEHDRNSCKTTSLYKAHLK